MTQQTLINTYGVPGIELDPGPATGIEGTVPALLEEQTMKLDKQEKQLKLLIRTKQRVV